MLNIQQQSYIKATRRDFKKIHSRLDRALLGYGGTIVVGAKRRVIKGCDYDGAFQCKDRG